jgi:hypothetical protein
MKILVVDANSSSRQGRDRFDEFMRVARKLILKIGGLDVDIDVRTLGNLNDFLYRSPVCIPVTRSLSRARASAR